MAARGSVVGRARVVLDVDKRRYDRDMHDAEQRAHRTGRVLKGALTAGAIGLGIALAGAAVALRDLTRDAIDDEKALKQTQAVLKSTGGAAGVTAKEVTNLSTKIALYSGLQDDVVQSGANMLLTFTNLRNEAGKGNDIYNQSVVVLADMSTALGNDMPKAAIQLGKALNDPVKGITALRRVGVTFTDAQKDQIATLVESGHTMEAQKLILAELRKEFGGSAKAAGETFAGQLSILHQRLQGIGQGLLTGLLPAVNAGMDALGDLVGFIDKVASAPSLKVGIEIAAEGIRDFGRKIGNQLGAAVRATDWSQVGRDIGTAVGASITFTENALDGLLSSAMSWLQGHAGQFAELGLLIGLEIVNKLGDPNFWAAHWELIAVALLTIFGGRIFKVGGELIWRLTRGMIGMTGRLATDLAIALAVKLPEAVGRVFIDLVVRAQVWIGRLIKLVGDELEKVPRIFAGIFRFSLVAGFFRLFASAIDHVMGLISALLGALSHLPFGLGKPFKEAQGAIEGARKKVRELRDEIGKTHGKRVDVDVRLHFDGKQLRAGPGDGLIGAIGDGTMRWAAANPAALMPMPSAAATGSAAGLKPMILDDYALGRAMGLTLVSGYRPGAITSSGHVSLHASGQAIDMHGTQAQMTRYALAEARRPGIAEVIYSPIGWSHYGSSFTPITDATIKGDHYSHVHVGARSAGDGLVGAMNTAIGDGSIGKKGKKKIRGRVRGRGPAPGEPPEPSEPGVPPWGELPPAIELEIFRAQDSPDTADDILAHQHALDFLRAQLGSAQLMGLGPAIELDIRRGIREHESAIAELRNAGGPSPDLSPELEEAIFLAEDTPGTEDDVTALEAAEQYLMGQLDLATTAAERLPIRQALRGIRTRLTEARGQTAAARAVTEAPLAAAALLGLEREFGGNLMPTGGAWSTQTRAGGRRGEQSSEAAGTGRAQPIVNMYFNKPPEDPHPLLRSAKFAAEAVMG